MSEKKIGPGLYLVDNALHLDIPEMLEHLGIEDNEANRDKCEELAEEVLKESGLLSPTATTAYTHKHLCRNHGAWTHEGKAKKCKLGRHASCPVCNS